MLSRLHNDHEHIATLLQILQHKQERLERAEAINFNLIRDIIEYMQTYAEHSHHPLEEIIDEFYTQRHSNQTVEKQLIDEHVHLAEASSQLMAMLNLILGDIPVENEQLCKTLNDYVALQYSHIVYEEKVLFPKWEKGMNDADWQEIDTKYRTQLIKDPLFNYDENVNFEELRTYINGYEIKGNTPD